MRTAGIWFTTYIWGVIYLQQQEPPLFDSASIKLFTVQYKQLPATDDQNGLRKLARDSERRAGSNGAKE